MGSKASAAFQQNKGDIDQLWQIHEKVAGGGVGAKHGVEVLNRAAVVFVNACWEAYVEDLAREACDHLLTLPATELPNSVKASIGQPLAECKIALNVWALADGGWKTVLAKHRDELLSNFNTPKTEPVDALFKKLTGLRKLSASWSWKGMSADAAAEKLDGYVADRGAIVHRLKHDETVYKSWGTDYLNHVERLVFATDDAVAVHLKELLKSAPW